MSRPVAVLEPEARYGTCESCHKTRKLVVVAYPDTRFEVCRPCAEDDE